MAMNVNVRRAVGIPVFLALLAAGRPAARAVTLDACIDEALRANPDVRAAAERVLAARAAVREARSAYYPVLGGSASYARTDNPPQAFFMRLNQRQASLQSDFNNPPDTDTLALSLGAKYRLYDFGRRGLGVAMARGGAELARLALEALRNDLVHQVTRGYYSALQARAFVAAQEESVATLEESLRITRARVEAGSAVKSDALSLEVQLAQAREGLVGARNGVRLAVAALNTAIGTNLAEAAGLAACEEPRDARPPEREDECVLQDRPELRAARQAAAVARADADRARRSALPVLNAFGSLDWNAEQASDWERSYSFGVAAETDFFDGFRRSAAASGARARLRAAEAEVEKTAGALRLDLSSACLRAGEAWERLEVVRLAIRSAEEALRLTRQRYELGAADLAELLNAQAGLTGTRTRHAAALYDYLIARSDLERARGRLAARAADTQ